MNRGSANARILYQPPIAARAATAVSRLSTAILALLGTLDVCSACGVQEVTLNVETETDAAPRGFSDTGETTDCTGVLVVPTWLEAPIREAIGKPTGHIRGEDLADVSRFSLALGERGISDLTPILAEESLRCLTSLTDFRFSAPGNNIDDVSPLVDLVTLTRLNLSNNAIIDIGALGELTTLTRLNLSSNWIHDISPLLALAGLQELYVEGNPIDCVAQALTISVLTERTRVLRTDCGQYAY